MNNLPIYIRNKTSLPIFKYYTAFTGLFTSSPIYSTANYGNIVVPNNSRRHTLNNIQPTNFKKIATFTGNIQLSNKLLKIKNNKNINFNGTTIYYLQLYINNNPSIFLKARFINYHNQQLIFQFKKINTPKPIDKVSIYIKNS